MAASSGRPALKQAGPNHGLHARAAAAHRGRDPFHSACSILQVVAGRVFRFLRANGWENVEMTKAVDADAVGCFSTFGGRIFGGGSWLSKD